MRVFMVLVLSMLSSQAGASVSRYVEREPEVAYPAGYGAVLAFFVALIYMLYAKNGPLKEWGEANPYKAVAVLIGLPVVVGFLVG